MWPPAQIPMKLRVVFLPSACVGKVFVFRKFRNWARGWDGNTNCWAEWALLASLGETWRWSKPQPFFCPQGIQCSVVGRHRDSQLQVPATGCLRSGAGSWSQLSSGRVRKHSRSDRAPVTVRLPRSATFKSLSQSGFLGRRPSESVCQSPVCLRL